MTKKDYELIAQSIWRSGFVKDNNKLRQDAREGIRHLIAVDLASNLKKENPRFNTTKFMEACGFIN